jgi:hypothetical protein
MEVSSRRWRIVFFAVLWCSILLDGLTAAQTEMWRCVPANGKEIYSNRSLGPHCRTLDNLPKLIPAPVTPPQQNMEGAGTGIPQPRPPEPEQTPVAGGGRKIDPPSDDVITVHDVKATPNYNGVLGIATYQADMRLVNEDADWTAEKLCIEVRFRDPAKIFIDASQTACLDGLKPLDQRPFTVVYIGTIPAKISPVQAEARVLTVKWAK